MTTHDELVTIANTAPRRAIALARREGATAFRFSHALARLDERMETQSFFRNADSPAAVALFDRFQTAASIVEARREVRVSPWAAGSALRRLHALQSRHLDLVDTKCVVS